ARLAPENTLTGIELAARLGLKWIEIDAQLSRDGVAVLMHDDDLARTTDLTGAVGDHDWDSLRSADAGAWFGPRFVGTAIPRLDVAIARCRELGLGMHLEIKTVEAADTRTAEAVAALLLAVEPPQPLIVSSFSPASVAVAQARLPEVPRALAADRLPDDWRDISHRLGLNAWHLDADAINGTHPPLLHEAGLTLRAWTVNDPARAAQLVAWGVESVFTDDPPALLARCHG
ncbi:MAG TPA: glycerophosphodiester phosphodiesterase family protein, partial [Mycobacterium sp.]|nr:glycerophosphodiester phosphodiesterase family protein [Mycobacterium sp.]